jgi:hypothetical protein
VSSKLQRFIISEEISNKKKLHRFRQSYQFDKSRCNLKVCNEEVSFVLYADLAFKVCTIS